MITTISDSMGLRGEVRAFVFDGDLNFGTPEELLAIIDAPLPPAVATYLTSNFVTTIGLTQMAQLIVGETTKFLTHMTLSTSVIVTNNADTVAIFPDRLVTQPLTIHGTAFNVFQRYVAYFSTISFGTTGINSEGLLDAATTNAATNLWADSTLPNIPKSTTQSLVIDHQIQVTTG